MVTIVVSEVNKFCMPSEDDSADINFRFTLCSNIGALNYHNVVLEIDSWIGRTWTAIRINIDSGAILLGLW